MHKKGEIGNASVTDLRQRRRLEGYALKRRIKTVNRPRRPNPLLTPMLGE